MEIQDEVDLLEPQESLTASADSAVDRALFWLLDAQHEDGYWAGILESNACMEAEWLLCFHVLGIANHPMSRGLVQGLLQRQRADGSWDVYYGARAGDINTTVEVYAALRCQGYAADHPDIKRARDWIQLQGGVKQVRVFTRFWLALIGEWPWEETPNLPPEILFFPRWFPFNIYHFAAWARATLVPLCILSARRMVVPLNKKSCLQELFPEDRSAVVALGKKAGAWSTFFYHADRALKKYQRTFKRPPGRQQAIKMCLEWILRRQDADGAWGGIQPPWIYSLMALKAEGYPVTHPVMAKGLAALDAHWSYERPGGARFVQACESPVWDTLLSSFALLDCGFSCTSSSELRKAVDWILDQQVLLPGDWQQKLPTVSPGGWAFERANVHYPDVDDTAVALIVLAKVRPDYPDTARVNLAIERGLNWLFAMQCRNGGWGAFDKDNDKDLLTKIPFSDFGETIDPASVDVTAHVLEALGLLGYRTTHPAVAKALEFIRSEQENDGCWFGRWGVNYIYGTAAVLPALASLNMNMNQEFIRRAANWILGKQNNDGGWGESCASYMDDTQRGRGPSTASQTAWAMMSLLAVDGGTYAESLLRAETYLKTTQTPEGTWDEPYYTGTGFPGYGIGRREIKRQRSLQQHAELSRGFMINYNLYRHYFPLMALGRLAALRGA